MTGYLGHFFIFPPNGRFGPLGERALFANFQDLLGIHEAVKLNELGHQPSPAGLMAGAESGAIVAMEVFEEEDVVAPVRIALEFIRAAINWPATMLVASEDA